MHGAVRWERHWRHYLNSVTIVAAVITITIGNAETVVTVVTIVADFRSLRNVGLQTDQSEYFWKGNTSYNRQYYWKLVRSTNDFQISQYSDE
jgi:hypothetical protein